MQVFHATLIFGALCSIYILYTLMPSSITPTGPHPGTVQTEAIVKTADAFLDLLDADLRAEIMFPYEFHEHAEPALFPHPRMPKFSFVGERYGESVWSNFPVSDVPRPGVRMGNLTTPQRDAAMQLLSVALSEQGYSKINEIMGSDEILFRNGVPYAAGKDVYTIAFFGKPSVSDVWMLQFGGHHIGLNLAVYRSHAVLAPVLTGALPANYVDADRGDVPVRVLAAENDKAFALYQSLDDSQLEQATIEGKVSDLVLGPGEDGKVVEAVGLKGSLLNSSQRAMLVDLIGEWAGIINDAHAAPRLEEFREQLDSTFFAWSGPATHDEGRNGASYFRIQSPSFFVEFSPQAPGGDLTMHAHTIYRDHARGYGKHFPASGSKHVGDLL